MSWASFLQLLRRDLDGSTIRGGLVRAAGLTVTFKVAGAGVAFLASLLYARVLGPHGYGLYAYVVACTAILAVPAGLGLGKYLVREGARHPESLLAMRAWADRRVLVTGLASGILLAAAALIPQAGEARWLFVLAAPLPLLANLAATRQSLLQAGGWIVHSQWPRLVLVPSLTLLALFAWWLWRGTLRPMDLVIATVGGGCLTLAINSLQLRNATPLTAPATPPGMRLRDAIPFMWLGGLYLLVSRTDLLMLGALRGAEEAGTYAVAMRAAEMILLVGIAANTTAAPRFSRLHDAGDQRGIERLLTSMGRRVLVLTVPLALVLVLFAEDLLSWLYGAPYAAGAMPLRILGLAQLFVVAGGSIGTLLNMTGNERSHMHAVVLALVVNVVLNLLLIPRFGASGAAAATCSSLIVCRIAMQAMVRKHLGLRPEIL